MQINFGNLSNFKSSFRHYEIGNLFRLIKDNNYPTLGLEFSFTDQKDTKNLSRIITENIFCRTLRCLN